MFFYFTRGFYILYANIITFLLLFGIFGTVILTTMFFIQNQFAIFVNLITFTLYIQLILETFLLNSHEINLIKYLKQSDKKIFIYFLNLFITLLIVSNIMLFHFFFYKLIIVISLITLNYLIPKNKDIL